MADRLKEYRSKRDARRTPEPVPAGPLPRGRDDTFVIQQHHARRLHWDLRLERDGVLVSWALPRGVPRDPSRNHLAVHTEDHPLEYGGFSGEIPAGEYGGGRVLIHDRGTYDTEKWRDDEVVVVFHGARTSGRYALFQTRGKDWMIHRMDPPEPSFTPVPDQVRPMLPTPAARLPRDSGGGASGDTSRDVRLAQWAYEMAWPGLRALAEVSGGRLRLVDATGEDMTPRFAELRVMADRLAPVECLLDGVLVGFDADRRFDSDALAPRLATDPGTAAGRRAAAQTPAQLMIVDLLWLDGRLLLDEAYERRRALLDDLALDGPGWQTPPYFPGAGRQARAAAMAQGLPGVLAKRLDSQYRPGQRSPDWRLVKPAVRKRGTAASPGGRPRKTKAA